MRYFIWRLWYNFFWKTETIGNVRRVTNRFTGDFRLHKVHPLAMLGVRFTTEQEEVIKQLFRDDMIPEAQQLILKKIEDALPDVTGLAQAFLDFADHVEEK